MRIAWTTRDNVPLQGPATQSCLQSPFCHEWQCIGFGDKNRTSLGGRVEGDIIPPDVGWLALRTQRESYKDQPEGPLVSPRMKTKWEPRGSKSGVY